MAKKIKTVGGNLYAIAARELGDARQFVRLMDANSISDPLLTGIQNLTIPAISPSSDGLPDLAIVTSFDSLVLPTTSDAQATTPTPVGTVTGGGLVVPAGQPTGASIANAGVGLASLSWTAPSTGTGPFTYTVQYRTSGVGTWQVYSSAIGATAITITPPGNLRYDFQVAATNSLGIGAYSTTVVADFSIPSAPSNLQSGVTTATTVALTWSIPTTGAAPFSYTLSSGVGTYPGITGTSFSATGLVSSTTYTFSVTATNNFGTSVPSSAVIGSTSAAAGGGVIPSIPTNLIVTAANSTDVVLSWSASTGTVPVSYQVQYRLHNSPLWTSAPTKATTISYDVLGLASETSYDFQVQATNSAGASAYSTSVTTTTSVAAQFSFTLSVGQIQSTSVVLTWSASQSATSYDVYAGTSGNTVKVATVAGLTYTPTLLTPLTTYFFQVIANSFSTNTPSNSTQATTLVGVVRAPSNQPFSNTSIWNTPVGINATWSLPTDADTVALRFTGGTIAATIPVFKGVISDPLINFTVSGANTDNFTVSMRLPSTARMTAGSMIVYDATQPTLMLSISGGSYNVGTNPGNGITASAGILDRVCGDGIGNGGNDFGLNQGAGLIRDSDLAAGIIQHSLRFAVSVSAVSAAALPYPIQYYDANAGFYTGSLAYGSTVGIPSSVNVNTLGLTAGGLMLATALQGFGAIMRATSPTGGISFFTEPQDDSNPFITNMRSDLATIIPLLCVMRNQSAQTINGGGTGIVSPPASIDTSICSSTLPTSSGNVVAPLTGVVTTGSWATSSLNNMTYQYLLPAQFTSNLSYPVLLFLHDVTNATPTQLNTWFNTVAFRTAFPAIILAPTLNMSADPSGNTINWGGLTSATQAGESSAVALVQSIMQTYNCIASRIYVTGNGLGATGTWNMLAKWNLQTGTSGNLFTAGMPFGGADYINGAVGASDYTTPSAAFVQALKNVPVWAIHGATDTVIPPTWDQKIYAAEQAAGGLMLYSEVPATGHNVWDAAVVAPPPSGDLPGQLTVVAGILQTTTVSISWQLPTGTSPFTYWTSINASVPASTGAKARNYGGLTPGTSYSFTVYATNALGTGPVSAPLVMTTTSVQLPESSEGATITTSTANAIVNAAGEKWTMTSTGQVAVNGLADATTSNVIKLYYHAHQVYQENTDLEWYVKTNSADTWAETTDPTPVIVVPTTPTPTPPVGTPGSYFHVSNGLVYSPTGVVFVPHGLAVGDQLMATAAINAACSPLLDAASFQGLNLVRLACDSYQPPSYYSTFISRITAKQIVVHIEDHSGADGGSGVMLNASQQNTQAAWYAALASAYISNPYVTFGSYNEPSNSPNSAGNAVRGTVTSNHVKIYNAIRGTGNMTLIELEMVGGGVPPPYSPMNLGNGGGAGNNDGLYPLSAYTGMTNIIWGPHFYYWMTGQGEGIDETNQAVIGARLDSIISLCGQVKSKDGNVPVWITEFGPTLVGEPTTPGGFALCQAVFNRKATLGAFAWSYGPYDATNSTANTDTRVLTQLTPWGQKVRTWLQS